MCGTWLICYELYVTGQNSSYIQCFSIFFPFDNFFHFPHMVSLIALFIVWITLPWLFKAFLFKAPFSFCYEMCFRMRWTLQKNKKLFKKCFVWDFLCRLAVHFRGVSGFKEGLDRQWHCAPCFHLAGNLPVRRQENETLAVFSSPVEKALSFLHV